MRQSAAIEGCLLLMRAAVARRRLSAARIRATFPRALAGPRVSVSMSCCMHALSNAFIGWTRSRRRRVTFVPGPHQLYPGRGRSPRSYGGTYLGNSTTHARGVRGQPLEDTEQLRGKQIDCYLWTMGVQGAEETRSRQSLGCCFVAILDYFGLHSESLRCNTLVRSLLHLQRDVR